MEKRIVILLFYQIQTDANQTVTWWAYCSDFILLENSFMKGSALKL